MAANEQTKPAAAKIEKKKLPDFNDVSKPEAVPQDTAAMAVNNATKRLDAYVVPELSEEMNEYLSFDECAREDYKKYKALFIKEIEDASCEADDDRTKEYFKTFKNEMLKEFDAMMLRLYLLVNFKGNKEVRDRIHQNKKAPKLNVKNAAIMLKFMRLRGMAMPGADLIYLDTSVESMPSYDVFKYVVLHEVVHTYLQQPIADRHVNALNEGVTDFFTFEMMAATIPYGYRNRSTMARELFAIDPHALLDFYMHKDRSDAYKEKLKELVESWATEESSATWTVERCREGLNRALGSDYPAVLAEKFFELFTVNDRTLQTLIRKIRRAAGKN